MGKLEIILGMLIVIILLGLSVNADIEQFDNVNGSNVNATYDFIFANNLIANQNVTATNIIATGAFLGNLTVNESFTGTTLLPATNNTFDLGATPDGFWRNLFINEIILQVLLTNAQIESDIAANATKLVDKDKLGLSELNNDKDFINSSFGNSTYVFKAGDTMTGDLTVQANVSITEDLIVDTNTLFVNSSSNRVGIGTTAPSQKLHVAGSVNITVDISSVETIHFENDVANHIIRDNATCIIITGDTSVLEIC